MRFFGKSEPSEDATHRASAEQDMEKRVLPYQDVGPAQPSRVAPAIDAAVERRMLRKLDLRLPTLMAFFCMIHPVSNNLIACLISG
jgi:hypothetical protein